MRGRGSRLSGVPPVCEPSGGIEGGLYLLSWRRRPRLTPSSQALSCHTSPPSVSCSLAEDGSDTVLLCGESFLARELPVGKAALKAPFWTTPEQYCHSHSFYDIWIIPQVQTKEQSSSWWVLSQILSQLSASFKTLLESHHFYQKNSLNQERLTISQPCSPNRRVVACLVLTPLGFIWREWQWCWCQWWCC